MALSAGRSTLTSELEDAYYKARDGGVNGDDVIPDQAVDVGNAIHKYMETAYVFTDIVTPGTQTAMAAASTAGTPGVYAPGVGTGEGDPDQGKGLSFSGGDVQALIGDIETAYYKARDAGAEGKDVIPGLAADMKKAIHKFALTATVDTKVTVTKDQAISGYMTLVGTATSPLVAMSLEGTGTGYGSSGTGLS